MSIGDFLKGLFGSARRSEEEERLLQAIVENPDDDAPRLAYADHLTSRGDPYGDFVRVDVELAALPPDDPRRTALDERWGELMSKYGRQWVKPLRELELQPLIVGHLFPADWFERGMIEKVTIDKRGVVPGKADRLWEIAPTIRRLHFERCSPMFAEIGRCEYLSRVIALDLSEVKLQPEDLAALLDSPHLAGLRELNVGGSPDGSRLAAIVAGAEQLKSLGKLSLRGSNCNADGARAIAGAACSAGLVELDLGHCNLGDDGAAALADSPQLANLEGLDLGNNEIGPAGAKALADSPHLAKLKRLVLESCDIGDEGAAALAEGRFAGTLELLDLSYAKVGDAGTIAIAGSPLFEGLRNLTISGHEELGDAGVLAIAEAGDRSRLRELSIAWSRCSPSTLVTLVNSPALRACRTLDLAHTLLDATVIAALAKSPHLEHIEEIRLYSDNDLECAAVVDRFGDDGVQF